MKYIRIFYLKVFIFGGEKNIFLNRIFRLVDYKNLSDHQSQEEKVTNRDVRNFTVSYGNLRTVKINTWGGQRRKFGGLK